MVGSRRIRTGGHTTTATTSPAAASLPSQAPSPNTRPISITPPLFLLSSYEDDPLYQIPIPVTGGAYINRSAQKRLLSTAANDMRSVCVVFVRFPNLTLALPRLPGTGKSGIVVEGEVSEGLGLGLGLAFGAVSSAGGRSRGIGRTLIFEQCSLIPLVTIAPPVNLNPR